MARSLVDLCKDELCKKAQHWIDDEIDDRTIALAMDAQESHLVAKGRIGLCPGSEFYRHALENKGKGYQLGSEIDGAEIKGYCPSANFTNGKLIIRMDHSTAPDFWCEVTINMDHLKKWLLKNHDINLTLS